MAALAQTIAIVDRSGKVVSTSKQLKNVFKEAKLAYQERKAEIVAERRAKDDRELQKALRAMSVTDDSRTEVPRPRGQLQNSHSYSRGVAGARDQPQRPRVDTVGRQNSGGSARSRSSSVSTATSQRRISSSHTPLGQFNDELYGAARSPTSPHRDPTPGELVRSQTDGQLTMAMARRSPLRSQSMAEMDGNIDMDLAYGDYPFDHLAMTPKMDERAKKDELSSLVLKCKILLDEANCAQHSVKAIVAHLSKNPEAMAAVGLTLAEISNLATKMAPGALMSFRASAPAVLAMLAAPEFLIAVGVGIGITVVCLGGYKIIKKIKARASEKDEGMDEMINVAELDRIQHWRRGLPDPETASVATSVEQELITPMAAASMGHLPSSADQDRSRDAPRGERKKKHRRRESESQSEAGSERSSASRRSHRRSRIEGSEGQSNRETALVKVKKPSPLRRMFQGGNSVASSDR